MSRILKIKNKKRFSIVLAIGILLFTGGVFALNGWFGGGSNIPSDTMTRGLVGYWSFDEGASSTAFDLTSNANNGILTSMSATSSWVRGKVGGALSFDGKDDYVNAANKAELTGLNAGSWEMWVNSGAYKGTDDKDFFNGGYWNDPYGPMFYVPSTGNNFTLSLRFTDASVTGVTSNSFTPGRWYHIVLTYDGNTMTGYVDGVLFGTATPGAKLLSHSDVHFGGGTGTRYWDGLLDEVRIYNRALSAQEVRYHYNRGGPVGWWRFDEGMGTTTFDGTDNNNDGVLTNMSATSSWAVGRYGSAILFDGVDDYVNAGNGSSLNITGDLTIEAWFKSNLIGAYQEIISKFDGGLGTTYPYEFRIRDTGKLQYCHGNGSSGPCKDSTAALSAGNWYHLAVIRSGSYVSFYINGVLDSTQRLADTPQSNTDNNVWIGWRNDSWSNGKANGLIDDVRIYNYARTAEETRLDYNAGFSAMFGIAPGSCDKNPAGCMDYGLAGYWNFDEGSGPVIYDKSNNGNDGVFNDGGSGNPVAYWTFDEGAGTTTYDRISINHGTLGNGTTATTMPSWTPNGKVGGALAFDGSNDYVEAADHASLDITSAITIEGWIKLDVLNNNAQWQRVVSKWDGANGYILMETTDGKIHLYTNLGDLSSVSSISAGVWYYISVTYDSSGGANNAKVFINGVQDNQATWVGSIGANNNPLRISRSEATSDFVNGSIDDVRIYNYARGATQIRQDYLETYKSKYAQGAPAMTGGKAGGYQGTALQFDGVDDFVSVSSSTSFNFGVESTSRTIEFWTKSLNTTDANVERIFHQKGTGNYSALIIRYKPSTNLLYIDLAQDGADANPNYAFNITKNLSDGWHHVVFVYTLPASGQAMSSITSSLYIDGVAQTYTPTTAGNLDSSGAGVQPLYMGRDNGGSPYFQGLLDEVRIYSRVLSAEEVRYHYNKGAPVGWWRFDEGAGTSTADNTWNNNNGTMVNMSATSSWENGRFGSTLLFDGVDDYLTMGYSSVLSPTTSLSWSAWIKTGISSRQGIISRSGNQFQTDNGLINPYVRIGTDSSYTDYGLASNKRVDDNRWHFVATTYESGDFRIYVDGAVDKRTSGVKGNLAPQASAPLEIGRVGATPKYFNGLIDDARVYNYARSAEQIWQDFNAGLAAYFGSSPSSVSCSGDPAKCMEYGLMGYWNFDEANGGLVPDKSNNRNNGFFNDGGSGNPNAYWGFDEGAGTTTYDSIGLNHGTMGNGTTATTMPSWTPNGKIGGALQFDGNNDYVVMADSASLRPNAASVAAWFKPEKTDDFYHVVHRTSDAYLLNLETASGAGRKIRTCFTNTLSSTGCVESDNPALAGNWYYAVGTWDGTTVKLYVNGVLQSTTAALSGTLLQTAGSTWVGTKNATQFFWPGIIDDVRIYNYARGATQIQQDYLETYKSKYAPGAPASSASGLSGGYQGSALQFDGVDDFVSAPNISFNRDYTINLWAKWDSTSAPDGGVQQLVGEMSSGYGPAAGLAWWNSGNFWSRHINASTYSDVNNISFTPTVGTWYNIAVTYESGSKKIIFYVNGAQTGSAGTHSINWDLTSNFDIGKNMRTDSPSQEFPGLIDEVRIYGRALSPEEIRYHYNRGGPIGWWKLDEGASSTAYDATLNNNDGVLTNMNATTSWVRGKYGSALNFDGVNDKVVVGTALGSNSLPFGSAATFEAWIKPNSQSGGLDTFLNKNWELRFGIRPDLYLEACVWDDTGGNSSCASSPINTVSIGKWQHVVYVHDTSYDKIFVDGKLVISELASFSVAIETNTNSASIGVDTFNGLIDDVRIYNYARTPAQVLQDYNAGLSTYFK